MPQLRHQSVFLSKALKCRAGIGVVLVVEQPTGSDGYVKNDTRAVQNVSSLVKVCGLGV